MAAILTRSDKGSALSHEELDTNFNNLNDLKLESSEFSSNSTLLIRDKDGNLVPVQVSELRIMGRITGGNIKGLTAAEVKTLLAYAIVDVSGLTDALALKADDTDLVMAQDDITDLQTDVADLEAALSGMTVFAQGTDTLVAGTKATTVVDMVATDLVVVGHLNAAGVPGALYTLGAEAGGFTCKSTEAGDTSTYFYIVFRTS